MCMSIVIYWIAMKAQSIVNVNGARQNKKVKSGFIKGLSSTQQWRFHHKLPSWAIWQKFSNNKNIINLINCANEWHNLKMRWMLHNHDNYIISSFIPENNTPFRPAVTEELRGNEILARLLINKTTKLNANEGGWMKLDGFDTYMDHPVLRYVFYWESLLHMTAIIKIWTQLINLIIMQINYII
jgi:hypothetical protein